MKHSKPAFHLRLSSSPLLFIAIALTAADRPVQATPVTVSADFQLGTDFPAKATNGAHFDKRS